MKKILGFFLFALVLSISRTSAQTPVFQNLVFVSSAPSGACTNGSPVQVVISTGSTYSCQAGTWGQVGGGGAWPGYPSAGIVVSTGSAWSGSVALGTLTDTKWCTYTIASGLSCTQNAPQVALTNPVTGPVSPTAGLLTKWGPSGDAIVDAFKYGTLTATDLCSYDATNGLQCTTATSTFAPASGIGLSALASQAADTIVMNASGSSAAPTAVAAPSGGTNGCAGASNATTYNSTTHAWGCNTLSGSGTVTDGAGTTTASAFTTSTSSAHVVAYPSLTSTLDSSGNAVFAGNVTGAALIGNGTNGGYVGTEGTGASVSFGAGKSGFYPDSTNHCLHFNFNNTDVGCGVASAASLTNNALMAGAGSQGAKTVTTGTGVVTAIGVNTGSAGAVGVLLATGTAAMNTAAVASGACETVVTVAATGVATTDVIEVGFNGDPTAVTGYGASATGAVLTIYPYPTAGNVNFKVCNSTANSITPGALTLNWKVYR